MRAAWLQRLFVFVCFPLTFWSCTSVFSRLALASLTALLLQWLGKMHKSSKKIQNFIVVSRHSPLWCTCSRMMKPCSSFCCHYSVSLFWVWKLKKSPSLVLLGLLVVLGSIDTLFNSFAHTLICRDHINSSHMVRRCICGGQKYVSTFTKLG